MSGVLVDREVLRDALRLTEAFASLRHVQASVHRNPDMKAELLREVARAHELENQLRSALAPAGDWRNHADYCAACDERLDESPSPAHCRFQDDCLARTRLAALAPASEGQAEREAEQEGIEAALRGSLGTHNPYFFREGKEALCEAWARGNARVWALVGEHARRAADAATGLMGKPYAYRGITRERHGEPVTLLRQEGKNVYYLSKTGHVFQSSERMFHKCFRALADALGGEG